MLVPRVHYQPRLSLLPIKAVRHRSRPNGYGEPVRSWRFYLFGLVRVPFLKLSRKAK